MTINRARLSKWTAIWIAAVWLGPESVSGAAQEKAAFPVATPESQGISAAAVRRVAGEVEEYVKNGTIVGGELLIIKNRKTILHEVYGERDREAKRAMERDTIFNIRSMTKPLTGVAVQMLADEGKLRLDDPVAKYLPGFDNDKSKAITIEQLLQHRSGLPLTIITVRIDEYSDLQAQAKAIGEKGPQFKSGEKFWYSDAGSDAAAAVAERISGMTIDRFVAERGFVLLPRRWVVERSFGWAARFRRLARDYERLSETLAGLHYVAFSILMLQKAAPLFAWSS